MPCSLLSSSQHLHAVFASLASEDCHCPWSHSKEGIDTKFKDRFVWGFPGGSVVKNLPVNAGDTGSIPDLGRSHVP